MGASVVGGVSDIYIRPGSKVLYLGGYYLYLLTVFKLILFCTAASGTTVSHVSDIVGPTGIVYAVEFSPRSGRDLVNMAKKRTNVIPIIGDARKPLEYRYLTDRCTFISTDDITEY